MAFRQEIAIGARRLAIVDPIGGAQPFWSEDGSIVAVVNGEIFNHRELRQDLHQSGVRLKTQCDAELVPYLYQRYGVDFVDRINGQFAIALYDFPNQRFLAWRDPFGICPFFYFENADQLIFASEIKAILKHEAVAPRLDVSGFEQIFTFPGPVSPNTLFVGVKSLAPGHRLDMCAGEATKVAPYWDLLFEVEAEERSVEAWSDELESLLLDAVRLRAPTENDVGLYLSGGLDSSLIGAMLKNCGPDRPIESFSIDFEDALVSEAKHQMIMADALGAHHTTTKLNAALVRDRLRQVIWHTETPLRESFNAASLILSEMAHQAGLKVVLAGQGADELFAGYVGYRFDARTRRGKAPINNFEATINASFWGDPQFVYERNYGAFAKERRSLFSLQLLDCLSGGERDLQVKPAINVPIGVTLLQRRSYVDCKLRLADHLLSGHGDRMAMANSVEVRFPFLDPRVARLAMRMPDQLKLSGMKEKFVVKEVGSRWLPAEIPRREKFGFTAPGSPTLINLEDPYIDYCLSDELIRRQGVFDPLAVSRLKEQYSAPGFRIAVPYQADLLMTVLTYSMFAELFGIADL